MFFDQLSFSSLRIVAIYVHFIVTCVLFWTKYDSLRVSLSSTASAAEYNYFNRVYTALLSFGLLLIILEAIVFALKHQEKSFASAMHLFMDLIAIFFIMWIILDGLDWRTYIYIFVFCL